MKGFEAKGLREGLLLYRDRGGRWKDLAKACGVHATTIGRIANGETPTVEPDTWEALHKALPDIVPPPPWHGQDRYGEEIQEGNAGESLIAEMARVPVFDAGAGEPSTFSDGGYPVGQASQTVRLPTSLAKENTFAVKVHGDSMAPLIEEGDLVVVEPSQAPTQGGLCFATWPEEFGRRLIKYFFQYGETIILRSHNPKYEDEVLDESNGQGIRIYRVSATMKIW